VRIVNHGGRLGLLTPSGVMDVANVSGGLFCSDPQAIYSRWHEFQAWASQHLDGPAGPLDLARLGPPVPKPGQVFAVGLNYHEHAAEAGMDVPDTPLIITKFPAAITGPNCTIGLPSATVDFEAELVAVIGRPARWVAARDGWQYVAGLTVGQDLSDREVQFNSPAPPQFSLSKSFEGFAPIGPAVVSLDEFSDPDDVEVGCSLSGELMQKARTSDFIFSVPEIIAYLSSILLLSPGDLIFTGTPSGVGWARDPRRLITASDELVTWVAGVGEMRHHFIGGDAL
jgi:2-keto-4-pentenoate hydratase/2-oxohepta-3-ene-1,7-dioic acid hydratase in catechol pathway